MQFGKYYSQLLHDYDVHDTTFKDLSLQHIVLKEAIIIWHMLNQSRQAHYRVAIKNNKLVATNITFVSMVGMPTNLCTRSMIDAFYYRYSKKKLE